MKHDVQTQQLPVPPRSAANELAREVLRAWTGPDGFEVILDTEAWESVGVWGIALVDIARNVANALADNEHERNEHLSEIRRMFDAEWNKPTDWPKDSLDS